MEKRFIYADNAATTKVSKEVLDTMLPYFTQHYGNPSSIYEMGRYAQKCIEQARETIANCLGCKPTEIFFTSCGSEADNGALKSTCVRST